MPLSSACFEGPLNKWTNLIQGWQFRWFVLDQQNGLLSYYTSKENITKGERRGCVRLREAYVGFDKEDDITFTITVHDKTFHLQARNLDEREKWVSKIEKTIRLHSSNKSHSTSKLMPIYANGSSALSRAAKNYNGNQDSLDGYLNEGNLGGADNKLNKVYFEQFDSCLAESDAYMQMLIEQLNELQEKRKHLLSKRAVKINKQHSSHEIVIPINISISGHRTNSSSNLLNSFSKSDMIKQTSVDQTSSNNNLCVVSAGGGMLSSSLGCTSSPHGASVNDLNFNDLPNVSSEDERNSSKPHCEYDQEQDGKMRSIIEATENLIETLKHAIICLQIAKANCNPKICMGSTYDLNDVLSNLSTNYSHSVSSSKQHREYFPNLSENLSNSFTSTLSQSINSAQKMSLMKQEAASDEFSGKRQEKDKAVKSSKNSNEDGGKAIISKTNNQHKTARHVPTESYSSSDDENGLSRTLTRLKTSKEKSINENDDENNDFKSYDFDVDDDDDADDDQDFLRKETDDNDSENFYDAIDQNYTSSSSTDLSKMMTINQDFSTFMHSATTINMSQNNNNNNLINQECLMTAQNTVQGSLIATQTSETISRENMLINNQKSVILTTSSNAENISNINSRTSMIGVKSSNSLIALDGSSPVIPDTRSLSPKTRQTEIEKKILEEYELFDEDAPQEDIDVNNQQSVIAHLLPQVRIGMDLTKITLPTFILEPRSLLEMYADFFAHTDLFLAIPDIKNPRDRMVQVVKWYLSTFHAGRKSPVAKKPYNPILGEIFQCWYSDPTTLTDDKNLVTDGPVPWASRDQLTFIAEQVSHHPPISAFYAEHYNKRIQVDGYTWTKSKFLGLSIGVHMIGKAVLSLLDLDEEYVANFPSAYGRSILTLPWFEMGGEITISCAKTGYNANIEFLTKPFYGGKKHQIQGTIFGPDKKALYTLDGDWNGTMFIKNGTKKDILISTSSTPIIKKQVRPLNEQNEWESRKLWREVTYYLRTKQIDLATEGKQKIEQKQRDDVKMRKENNSKIENKYFQEQGENWIYVKPLIDRLSSSNKC